MTVEVTSEDVKRLGTAFETLCTIRDIRGAEEYGETSFAQNDVIRMMAEELADTANYCRYQFIKLMKLQEQLSEMGLDMNDFQGTKKEDWK